MRASRPLETPVIPAERAPRTAFVNMPFASSRRPSIQLGLLKALVGRVGIPAETHYFNLELGAVLGWEPYESLCHTRDILLGEWLFARAAFGDEAPDPGAFVDHYGAEVDAACDELDRDVAYLLELREEVLPAFVDGCVRRLDWSAFDVVAFSSIFEQNCAALALARRLKTHFPELVTIFGGANFEDDMGLEYVRALPWIDYAVVGEGDQVLPALLGRLAAGDDAGALPGVATRERGDSVRFAGRAPQVTDLDALPEPDYSDYFEQGAELGLPPVVRGQVVGLPFETARGCWWGVKHHCTFCGLNGLGMAFRRKSPPRVLSGVDELAERYGTYAFVSVDNILDHGYVSDVFEPLARERKDYTFFFEVKANLTPAQLRALAAGGLRVVQPGIESLSTNVLRLMRKGTTELQNVRFLKWGRYYGLTVAWNVLLGFPGERAGDYRRQVETMRLIPHLCPPGWIGRIRLDRFSPNFEKSGELGFHEVAPIPAYSHTYPDRLDHEAIAYFFAYDAPEALADEAYAEITATVREWQRAWERGSTPFLVFQRGARRLTVTDGRYGSPARVTSFGDLEADVYECCTLSGRSPAGVVRMLSEERSTAASLGAVERILSDFVDAGLMLEEDGRYLALAVPTNPNW